ncbi:MAG: hypothetical protein IPM39_29375 [Chloroflexi bacterium]|nr:hypothetical protein [Chloroflexota bacterium]
MIDTASTNITLTITLKQCRNKDGGVMHFNDAGTYALVSDTETGQSVGGIGACIGGGFEIALGKNAWFIAYPDIWAAFEAAIEQEEADGAH